MAGTRARAILEDDALRHDAQNHLRALNFHTQLLGSGRCCAASYIVRSLGEASAISDHWQKNLKSERATTPAFPACFVGDLIAMTRKNLAISPL